jgi:hypothetical protein
MSSSDATEDTSKKRKMTFPSVVSADGCSVDGAGSADGFTKSNDDADASSGNTVDDVAAAAANDLPGVVSSTHPLFFLATAIEDEIRRPEIKENSYPAEQGHKSLSGTDKNTAASELRRSVTMVNERTTDCGTTSTECEKLSADPPFSKDRDNSMVLTESNKQEDSDKGGFSSHGKEGDDELDQESMEEPETDAEDEDNPNSMRIVEATWNWNYKNLVEYHDVHGHSNVLRSDPNKQLSGWVKRQRNNLKDGKLSPSKILMLNELDFVWDRIDGRWYKKFCQLVQFQAKFGHCYVTAKYDRSLAEWTQRQRRDYKNGMSKMTEERIQKLEALDGWSWDKLYKDRMRAEPLSLRSPNPDFSNNGEGGR